MLKLHSMSSGLAQWLFALGFGALGSPLLNAMPALGFPMIGVSGVLMISGTIVAVRGRLATGRPLMEPSQLIVFGLIGGAICLLVAAGGYWWQSRTAVSPQPNNGDHTAATTDYPGSKPQYIIFQNIGYASPDRPLVFIGTSAVNT